MVFILVPLLICLAMGTASGDGSNCGKGYIVDLGEGKYLMHLEGSPYEMGYQHGCLAGEQVERMTKEFVKSVLVGYDIPEDLIPELLKLAKEIAKKNEKYIPSEFIEEMRGIADGAKDAGYNVEYEDVLLLNMGFDIILSVAYPIATPIVAWQDRKGIACDGFVAMDEATSDGRVLMGRSFMFNPEVFHEVAMLIEQYPEKGHRFVSVSAPGFVGVTAAMSSAGIAIGMDMVPAMDTKPFVSGMGCLLTARQVVQYADELSDAINLVKGSKRGVPWLYIVGDGQGKEKGGAVLEVSADKFAVRYLDYKYPNWAMYYDLPRQIEDKDDLVVVANHYIVPEMYLTISHAVNDSLWRYETLTSLILDSYGKIDVEKGKELVDYLHPPNYGYYGTDENIPVPATRTLFDLTNLELWSLYGMYTDPWVHWKLEPESQAAGLDKADS
uniref:Peptidase C45 hydrolase domain-containing protein n=1 Tax=Archaeoglobus fulgidus TaxID=2234 RepID=A0A7C3RC05_ARCFL